MAPKDMEFAGGPSLLQMDAEQRLGVEYLEPPEPIDAEPMPEEFSQPRIVRSLVIIGIAAVAGVAGGPLLPGLAAGLVPAAIGALGIALVVAAGALAGTLARRTKAERLARIARTAAAGVQEAARLLRSGDIGLLAGSAGYMLFDVAMLGVCFATFGNDVPPAGVLLVAYIIGQLGGLIPLPGGLGGVDGGLIRTPPLYRVAPADAAAPPPPPPPPAPALPAAPRP